MNASRSGLLVKGCLVLGVAGLAVVSSHAVAWDGKTYVLSVRGVEIVQEVDTDDRLSPAPDLVVRIVRKDPDLREEIARLEDANERREAQRGKAQARYVRLDYLGRRRPTDRVEPLTDAQIRVRLRKYKREVRTLSREISATERRVRNLRGLLFGSSAKITTSRGTADFGDNAVIRVYPDDEIEVSVWDDDPIEDDLYGRVSVVLDRATLEEGSLALSMPNIRFVRLGFRRDESVPPAE